MRLKKNKKKYTILDIYLKVDETDAKKCYKNHRIWNLFFYTVYHKHTIIPNFLWVLGWLWVSIPIPIPNTQFFGYEFFLNSALTVKKDKIWKKQIFVF